MSVAGTIHWFAMSAFSSFPEEDIEKWEAVIKTTGIKID
jgi:hypothetical protein